MRDYTKFYINGSWVEPSETNTLGVENPATLEQCATISIGSNADVDNAVAAAGSLKPSVTRRAPRCSIRSRDLHGLHWQIAEALQEMVRLFHLHRPRKLMRVSRTSPRRQFFATSF